MVPFDRALLAVYTLFITVLSALFAAVMLGWPAPLYVLRDIFYPGRPEVFWTLIVALILAGVRLFWLSLVKPRGRHVVLVEGALGEIRVSLRAVEDMVDKEVSLMDGVKEVKSRMVAVSQGVGIRLRASVTPDVNVPSISTDIQNRVKKKVFEVTGLTVNNIKVSIDNISAKKPRVE